MEKFKKGFSSEENLKLIKQFFDEGQNMMLVFAGDSVTASLSPPKKTSKNKMFVVLKNKPDQIKPKDMESQLVCGELGPEPLEHLEKVIEEVYMPVLSNTANQHGWGEVASKEIVEKLHSFLAQVSITLGQTRGKTCLPLPPMDSGGAEKSASGGIPPTSKDRIHLLEGAVITWTKQIKAVLKQDPEGLLKQGLHPTPDREIAFWDNKAENLNAIFEQLQGDRIRRVLRFLDQSKSTYCTPFAKLCKEVFTARIEANDNVKFLRTLESWFQSLNNESDFPKLIDTFKPMMHIILLIWKNSKHYNTPGRLVVLMREICNALISQACSYISGEQIFALIEAEEAGTAVQQLKTTLKVCGTFKSTYFDYKATANAECPSNPWRIQNNALFMRLDSFLERCHDILDLTQTIVQFSKLASIEVGGTKGKTLSTSVQQIYNDFQSAVETFKQVQYDIMDVGAKQFDDDFYEFRCKIKELERRLGSLLTQGFDDCATIYSRFKLLNSFEGLLDRPIIQDELEKKHVVLVQSYGADLKEVQELFLAQRDEPPISSNLPPMSGAISWCRGLMSRIQLPMEKLKSFNKAIMEREETKEVTKVFANIMTSLEEYTVQKIEEWAREVEASSQAKLKLPLLIRNEDTRLLSVNFDPSLVRLLRETKYFTLLSLDIPSMAQEIYKKVEVYRRYTGNLDLIINMYNNMMTTILPVERPLVQSHLEKIDRTLQRGIKQMNWKSHGIDMFITESMASVKAANDILSTLKKNLSGVEQILENFARAPLLERKAKPVTIEEFQQAHHALKTARYAEIKEGGSQIHKLIKDSNKILKVSQGLPDWKAYVDFMNNVVVDGLAQVVIISLEYLADQIDPDVIQAQDKMPLLEIKLNLHGKMVSYEPTIEHTQSQEGIRDIINGWVESFFKVGTLFKRIDTNGGTYIKELQNNMQVRGMLSIINECLAINEQKCSDMSNCYEEYSFLWETELGSMFNDFLDDATLETRSDGTKLLNLGKFDDAVTKYRGVQEKVAGMKTPTDLSWLRVNSQPIKQALATWTTKWIFLFTQHLHDDLQSNLNNLLTFSNRVNAGLDIEVESGMKEELMDVMAHVRDVKKAMDETRELFSPLRDTVALLKTHGITLDSTYVGEDTEYEIEVLEYLETAPMKWDAVVNKMFKKKEEILSLQQQEAKNIGEELEKYFLELRAFRNDFRANAPFAFMGEPTEAYSSLDDYDVQLAELKVRAAKFNELEELFELDISRYNEIPETRNDMRLLKSLWDFRSLLNLTYGNWKQALWADIDTEDLEDQNKKLQKQVKSFGTQNQIVKGWAVYKNLEASLKDMAVVLPLINDLHSPSMRDRHWKTLSQVCHCKAVDPKDPKFCLENLIALKLHLHADDVSEIVETANKELKVDNKLKGIEQTWASLQLEFVQHKDTDIRILKVPDEVIEALEGHQLELQTMIGMGKFVDFFRARVTGWQKQLGNVESVLKEWSTVTKAWASLESIFLGSQDIRAQLPDDTKRFEGIDQAFKDLMKGAVDIPNVIEACSIEDIEDDLKRMTSDLEICQKALNDYLDAKKKIFPRFYFVSNVALLDILSNGNNPPAIMPYVSDCYDSIKNLEFKPESITETVAMFAKDGEKVDFPDVFTIQGAVEHWLNDLTEAMQNCLKFILAQAIDTAVHWEVETPRHKWLFNYPAQIVLQCTQIYWTEEAESALDEYEGGQDDAVKSYYELSCDRLQKLINLVQGDLKKPDRRKIIALITMDVHGRDCVHKLIAQKCEGPGAFLWQQQLRFYWAQESRDVNIKICDYRTMYTYEYVGNTGRLVITPLTDRCYITLTTALRLFLGGAPAGPAGTGKTETTKDLARALALPCYVFNCSDQMNFETLADIFRGLSQSGSWGCFDEFNRIPIEVLSVVATQVKTIQDAIVLYSVPANRDEEFQHLPAGTPPNKVGYFDFMGDRISLVPTTGSYITMNPGYAGRTELPENLKVLFRSCAMIRPDLALICENMLMAEGFTKARPLSIKFVELYTLSSELLSPQAHYDWGLRAVKSVLRVAGALKRASPNMAEEPVLMRALRDFNTPKIPANDIPIFLRLIKDLFPQYAETTPRQFDEDLKGTAAKFANKMGLQSDESFTSKVVEFQELLDVRHSVMLIGPGGCGKTRIWECLQGCHNWGKTTPEGKPRKTCYAETVNPKAVTSDELYGYMTLSKDWKDGVLSILMRGMSKNFRDQGFYDWQTYKWVVLDGDIDAVWIESMNTVMDDNKVLTLVSNERIPLSDAMRMVFEINSLANATPATVSRAGILFINATDIGWRPYVESWVGTREDESEKAHMPGLFDRYIEKIIENTRRGYENIVPHAWITKVETVCYLLNSLLGEDMISDPAKKTPETLESLFVFACIWAFGGPVPIDKTRDYRKDFDAMWRTIFTAIKFPKDGLVFDYFYSVDQNEFLSWSEIVPEYVNMPIGNNPGEVEFNTITVQTCDSTRLTYLMHQLVKQKRAVMFVGGAGTGKTSIIKDYLANTELLDPETNLSTVINTNYYTDSKSMQMQLEGVIDKRSGKIFGPPSNKKMIYFIDDINLCYVEEYGTQNSHELLRQHMGYGSFYDRVDLGFKKDIVDCQYLSAMNPTAGSFFINERFQRYFSVFAVMMPSTSDLKTIYEQILAGHFEMGFSNKVGNLSGALADAAIALLQEVQKKFLPSAIKFVYNWNMRELNAIFQGLTLAQGEMYSAPVKMVRLWLHECKRVFADRLINEQDLERFNDIATEMTKRYFSEVKGQEINMEEVFAEPIVFSDFVVPTAGEPAYLPIVDIPQLSTCLEQKLVEYNESNSIMELVLFEMAMRHVCRICRIISNPQGNAMLIGVGGSGKQSLSRLSAFICQYDVTQLSVSSDFSVEELKENLREMYKKAGVKGTPMVFLMTDGQIVNEKFLVYLNCILSSGWIPDLFPKEDMDGIFGGLRSEAKQAGIQDTPDTMTEFFISRVRKNLHVILCFSPVGDLFRVRARRFPGLINCTCIDWFHAWPKDALISVGSRFLADIELGSDEQKENVAHHMAEVHLSVTLKSVEYKAKNRRFNYVTPKSYLELINFYKGLLQKKREESSAQIDRLDVGLSTLRKTAADVAELQVDLQHTMVKVEEKKKATDALIEQMGKQRAAAEEQQAKAAIEKTAADKAAAEAAAIEESASEELAAAKPAMLAAGAAVDCLNKASIGELRGFGKPPGGVEVITEAVLRMVEGEKKNFKWDRAKKMMKDVNAFIQKLKFYNMKEIPEELIDKLTPLMENPMMNYDVMMKKSGAAANLCNWVIAVYTYNRIYVKVKPLMDSLNAAQAAKAAAEAKLAKVMKLVADVDARLQALQKTFMEATSEKAAVEAEANACLARLSLAERLVGGLSSENERWGNDIEKLQENEVTLVGDVLLSSAFVSYIGAFDAEFRNSLWRDIWLPDLLSRQIPLTEGIDALDMIMDSGRLAVMQGEGLPADRISTENGSIITNCTRWPLIIDPQLQGIKWLRSRYETKVEVKEGGNEEEADKEEGDDAEGEGEGEQKSKKKKKKAPLIVMQLTMKNWVRKLGEAISGGWVVILENVGQELDATLDPVLARAVYKKGRNYFLNIGGEEVEYDQNFRLFMTSKLSNPHYKPEIAAQCTLINFIATESGLEDQLLARVVQAEKPELEEESATLQKAFNDYKIQLLGLEDDLLERLANAPDDILSDVPLIEGLEATKAAVAEINVAVEKGKTTEILINKAREVYRLAAKEAAMLYFMLTELSNINHMYQYSLDSFVQFFYKAIEKAIADENENQRVLNLRESLRFTIFTWVARGLFEEHKLIFLGQLTFKLMQRGVLKDELNATYFQFLLRGPKKMGEDNPLKWMPEPVWEACQALGDLEDFGKFPTDLAEADGRFLDWYNHQTPETEKLPLDWAGLDKTPFLKLLVIRCMRPDRMTISMMNFVRYELPDGNKYADCDGTLNSVQILEQSLLDSSPLTPIYFILSPGADVVADVDKMAIKYNKEKGSSYHNVSMGQGQGPIAMEKLELGHKQGHWVILNNVHLMPAWLILLEKRLDEFNQEGSHPDFRVFISSDPSKNIPIGVLARCIKLTNEPPAGLKANLKRAIASFSRDFMDEAESKVKAIIFGLCHFHSVMMERKKFKSKGFNMMYPFTLGDLRDSSVCLTNYMENAPSKIPWEDLRYIFGEIIYGGHIVNDFDRLLCNEYLRFYMRDELLDEMELFPFAEDERNVSFKAPSPTTYDRYLEHVDTELRGETPIAFGLHPNAEIDFRTTQSNTLFSTLLELQPRDSGGESGMSPQHIAENMLNDIQDRFADKMLDIDDVESSLEEKGPYQNVFLQECEAMNTLLTEIARSLTELNLGFAGELTMSDKMEALMQSLYMDRVPGSWASLAWPSLRPLAGWLLNFNGRLEQLIEWCGNPADIPKVTWLSGMINPTSFLTAIKQMTAQRTGQELDKLVIWTDVLKKSDPEEIEAGSRDGAYCHGLFMQGARWDATNCMVQKAQPKEMYVAMPIVNCKSVSTDKAEGTGIFSCPVYKTEQRGPTWVFCAQLKTKSPAARWILAGVSLIMDIVA
jgi:dynein heavy chain